MRRGHNYKRPDIINMLKIARLAFRYAPNDYPVALHPNSMQEKEKNYVKFIYFGGKTQRSI